MRVKFTQIDAPADTKILRGDTILKLDGTTATPALLREKSAQLGTTTVFTVQRGNRRIDVSVAPKLYSYSASKAKVLEAGNSTVGYLRLDTFSDASKVELQTRFALFKQRGIDDLVIDLRYNGGGTVDAAIELASYITGTHPGETVAKLIWNDQYQSKNSIYKFTSPSPANALALERVFFLVTEESASASELVIHALKPYFGDTKVVTIGTKTHGKNVGMSGVVHNDFYYFLINFYVVNSVNTISRSTGIAPICPATDDLDHAMGDASETLLSAALHYIDNDSCPPVASRRQQGERSSDKLMPMDGRIMGLFVR